MQGAKDVRKKVGQPRSPNCKCEMPSFARTPSRGWCKSPETRLEEINRRGCSFAKFFMVGIDEKKG